MATGPSHIATKYLSTLFESGTATGLGDHELVKRFAARRDQADQLAEAAFAALVSRHGPMVFQVCRAVLGDRHEAEDAFQATFLVLASRARSIRSRDSVGPWLYGVALRVSALSRLRATRRKHHERRHAKMTETLVDDANASALLDGDLARVLHEEIAHLPEKFRAAVVLCYLEGLTHEMAASELGCPVGTIRSRLATARDRLKRRLTRRGIALVSPADWLASLVVRVTEVAPSTIVPGAVAECTIRGAMQVGLGKGALAGTVSAGAVALMEGVLMNMMETRLTIAAATLLVAGVVTAGVGVASYSSLGRDEGSAPAQARWPELARQVPQKQDAGAPPGAVPQSNPSDASTRIEEAQKNVHSRTEEEVKALVREYQAKEDDFRNCIRETKSAEERKALQDRRPNPASYAGALLELAERDPGTPAAEDALIWIATHIFYGTMAERAKEMIVRDHIRSQKLEPYLQDLKSQAMVGSRATEQLFREALAKNPDRKTRCLACYRLGHFLKGQASFIRLGRLFDPEQRNRPGGPFLKESWGYDYEGRLDKLDPIALEHESALLFTRVIEEFAEIPLPNPFPQPSGDLLLPTRPVTYGDAARLYLHEVRDLAIGRPAPEIEGVDLDGKPMKLSDYRGKVVLLYFCGPNQLSAGGTGKPAQVTESVRAAAVRHANEPIAVLGVATPSPGRGALEREAFAKLLQSSGLPARFWWDQDPAGKPGPIQAAWNGRIDLYVIDPQGTIRYKHLLVRELLEKAVADSLKALDGPEGRPRDKD